MRKTLLVTGITGALALGGAGAALAGTSAPSTSSSSAAAISRAHAERTAVQQVPGSRVREAEMEREHGRLVWEVELLKNRVRYEVEISTGGKVLKVERRADHRGRDDSRAAGVRVTSSAVHRTAPSASRPSVTQRTTVPSGPSAVLAQVRRDDHGLRERHDINDDRLAPQRHDANDDRLAPQRHDINDDRLAPQRHDINDDRLAPQRHDINDDHGGQRVGDDHGRDRGDDRGHDRNDDHGHDR